MLLLLSLMMLSCLVVMFGALVDVRSVVVEDEVNDGVLLLQLYLMLCRMLL